MKVKRITRGYTLYLTDHEFGMMERIFKHFNIDTEWPSMDSGERRSWARRIRKGAFLRVDKDTRKDG